MTKSSKEFLKTVVRAADDSFAQDIVALDMEGLSIMSDYNVITHASNARLLNAIATNVVQAAEKEGVIVEKIEGRQKSNWLLIDLGDVLLHVFTEDERVHYGLESLWSDAKEVDISEWIVE